MKAKVLQFGLLGLVFAAAILAFSTSRPSKKTSPQVYSFYYYPKPNVYYNRVTKEYAFVNPEGNWQTATNLPYAVSLTSEKKVALSGPYQEIWKNNERHRMVYAASLYASASDLQQPAGKTLTVPRLKPKVEATVKVEDGKKETGVKRFFNKLFKKKKADSTEMVNSN